MHGAGNGRVTVFPQAIALELMQRVATAISESKRVKHHAVLKRHGHTTQMEGLPFGFLILHFP